jgi:hypothetical protein
MKQKTALMSERLKDVLVIINDKNPLLVQEVYKG